MHGNCYVGKKIKSMAVSKKKKPLWRRGSALDSRRGGPGSIPTQIKIYVFYFSKGLFSLFRGTSLLNLSSIRAFFTRMFSICRLPFLVPSFGHAADYNVGFSRNGAYNVFALKKRKNNWSQHGDLRHTRRSSNII